MRICFKVMAQAIKDGHRNKPIRFVFSGDFYQLAPIQKGKDGWSDFEATRKTFLFEDPCWILNLPPSNIVVLGCINHRAAGDPCSEQSIIEQRAVDN